MLYINIHFWNSDKMVNSVQVNIKKLFTSLIPKVRLVQIREPALRAGFPNPLTSQVPLSLA